MQYELKPFFSSFTAAHLQQNSYPERRPWEDLIDLRLSHSSCFIDACSDLLALHQCVISAKAQTESDEILEYFFSGIYHSETKQNYIPQL